MNIDALLAKIREGRARDASSTANLSSFDVLPADPKHYWAQVFQEAFLDSQHEGDDLLFFVPFDRQSDTELDIFRKHSTTRPVPKIGCAEYNWAETVQLNFALQYVTYELAIVILVKTPESPKLKKVQRYDQRVYASPSRRQMDGKGTQDIMTYPEMFFTIDNFDDVFENVLITQANHICVELVACINSIRTTVFSGAVTHTALATSYNSRKPGRGLAQMRATPKKRMEFLQMVGPKGLGNAEMAVSIADDDDKAVRPSSSAPPSQEDGKAKSLFKRVSGNTMSLLTTAMAHLTPHNTDAHNHNLNAFLTFVSLPIASIITSILDNPVKPIFAPSSQSKSSLSSVSVSVTSTPVPTTTTDQPSTKPAEKCSTTDVTKQGA